MTPILLLEINEIPWRLLDRYGARGEFPDLRAFMQESDHYTTMAVDTGELSPWVTWPTLHRGVNNEAHQIRNLGQDPTTFQGTPVWEEVRTRGGSIGVFGSMQSWPPSDPGPGGFYVPDTFAHDARCFPERLEPIQAFNLAQVRRNGRVVQSSVPQAGEAWRAGTALLSSGVRLGTMARTAAQLVRERFTPSLSARRPVFQTILFWDVFRKLFSAGKPPAFTTFFTNHVAGVMHRYWADVFPEDFATRDASAVNGEALMQFAIGVLDDILRDARAWSRANPDLVVLMASSMGQDAVHRPEHEGVELVVENLTALLATAGCAREAFQPLLAMVPQVAVAIADPALRAETARRLRSASCGGKPFIKVQEIGATLSITVSNPPLDAMKEGGLVLGDRRFTWQESGIRMQEIEPGTGYHIPQGTLLVHRPGATGERERTRPVIQADEVKDWLLRISAEGRGALDSPPLARDTAASPIEHIAATETA